jgi:hypothetical protein
MNTQANAKIPRTGQVALSGHLHEAHFLAKFGNVFYYVARTSVTVKGGYITLGTCQFEKDETFGPIKGVYVPGVGQEFDMDLQREEIRNWVTTREMPERVNAFLHETYIQPYLESKVADKTEDDVLIVLV